MNKNNIAILYPSCPLKKTIVDEHFREESTLAASFGLNVHCFDSNTIAQSTIIPTIPSNTLVLYRGWMLDEDTYSMLDNRLQGNLLVSKEKYLTAHHFPHWYNEISSLTIPSVITNEQSVVEDFKSFGGKAFIKDYVKSLKTGNGSIINSTNDLLRAIKDMKLYRGFIEGGIVLREIVDLQKASEVRFFIIKNQIFKPKCTDQQYQLAKIVSDKLALKNLLFYSLDIATKQDGTDVVIEIGDGQVSDYVGWQLDDFIKALSYLNT